MYRVADIGGGTHGLLAILDRKLDAVAFCDIREKARRDAAKCARYLKEKTKGVKEPTPVNEYVDYKEMILKEKPDIVMIATPDPWHTPMAIFALEHGAHVFVEKPMCISLEECDQMIAAVKRTGLKLAVNQCARTIQGVQTLFDMRDRGALGTPYYIRAEYLHGSMRQHFESTKTWRNQEQTTLGGSSHSIDLILGLMNAPPESVCATGSKHMFDERTRMNDMDNVLIRFPGGRTGYSVTSLGCWRRGLGLAFELYATKQDVIQTMTFDEGHEQAGLRFYSEAGAKTVCKFSETQMEIELGHGQGYYRQHENLLYAIEHDVKQRTMADVVDGARTVATGLAADESLKTGKAVGVRQWEPLTYKGKAPLWDLDDYQKDLLREFVPEVSNETRKRILAAPDGLDRTREER